MPNFIKLHRVFAAKPERLYRAFLEPDAVASWLPPFGFTCTVHVLEAKEGGKHRMSFRNFTTGDSHVFVQVTEILHHEKDRLDWYRTDRYFPYPLSM